MPAERGGDASSAGNTASGDGLPDRPMTEEGDIMTITKTFAAGLLAFSLAAAPANAAPEKKGLSTEVIVLGVLALATVSIIIGTQMSGGGTFFSSKDIKGTDGKPLPGSPSLAKRTVVMDF
jgi:hypothetical protein